VDDVVNEVMVVVWQRAAMFQPTVCVSAWLYGIAWNKAKKARLQRPQDAPEAPATRECGSHQDTPEQCCG
jgi:RNA polymerase sigma-70 factor (ECF subfamily)